MSTKTKHSFPRWQSFREAVDVALALPAMSSGRYHVYTEAFGEIASRFPDSVLDVPEARRPMDGDIDSELVALAKEISLASVLDRTPLEPYFSIAHILRDALRQRGLVPTVCADDEKWIDAIRIALTYNERKNPQLSTSAQMRAADITFANAVHFFNARGICLPLSGDQVIVHSKGVWSALAATAASPLAALGDTGAMHYMDAWLSARFNPVLGRVHFHPTPDLMGRKMDRSLPCGHLYRSALKVLGRDRDRARRAATPVSIGASATHLAALYEVEPFSTYETIFPPRPTRGLEVLMRVVLYDELFTVPQCDPGHMGRLLEDLFEELSKAGGIRGQGWTHKDAIELWRVLLSLAPSGCASTFVKRSQLRQLLVQRVGHAACDALVDAFVLARPNRNYHVPTDAVSADTRECTVAQASGDRYWIAPRPFLGPAFFARLVGLYAKVEKDLSTKIGVAFEMRMLARMKELGIECRRADVLGSKGKNAGDIDLILETDKVIAFFELKKKGLTRKTNAGNGLQLAVDLARGLVRGVNQLAKHEIALMRDGSLRLAEGGELRLDGRHIVKCVVSLSDYGGLHDGATLRNMMRWFCQVRLEPGPPLNDEQASDLEYAQKALTTLQARRNEFAALLPDAAQFDLFDNLMFHNVFFVEHLILTEQTTESLLRKLLTGNRIVTGARDAFVENSWFDSGR